MPLGWGSPWASAPEEIGLKAGRKGFAFTSLAGTPTAPEGRVEAGSSHTKHGSAWSASGLGRHCCPGDTSVDPSAVRKTSPSSPVLARLPLLGPAAIQNPTLVPAGPTAGPPQPWQTPQQGGPQSTGPSLAPCGDPGFKSLYSLLLQKMIPTASPVTICHQRHYLTFPTIPMTHLFCNWKSAPRNRPSISLLPPPL